MIIVVINNVVQIMKLFIIFFLALFPGKESVVE
jgi:hypothetical protein